MSMVAIRRFVCLVLFAASSLQVVANEVKTGAAQARLPLTFVPNRGQTDSNVRYVARGSAMSIALSQHEALFSFRNAEKQQTVALRFVGARNDATMLGECELAGRISYFRGSDPTKWLANLPTFGAVVYSDLWPGIDLRFRGDDGKLEYEFIVHPGASPSNIKLAYAGGSGIRVGPKGDLLIATSSGELRDTPPVSYQDIGGKRISVASRYSVKSKTRFGFAVGNYDAAHPLVIDPSVAYSTFLGSDDFSEFISAIAVDASGNAYVAGNTDGNFPTTPGAFDSSPNGNTDAFVAKLDATGSNLLYATFVGGSNFDVAQSLAVDAAGNVYLTGSTHSNDYPTTAGAFDRTAHGFDDVFVTKLNASGSALVYSTLIGTTNSEEGRAIAVDNAGNAYIAGWTGSLVFPTTPGAFDTSFNGDTDAFVAKVNAAGSALLYSTLLGGILDERAGALAIDPAGNAYVIGDTRSSNFPTTSGAFDTTFNGGAGSGLDAFVAKLNATGSATIYSSFLGGSLGDELAFAAALDDSGSVYITGLTTSADFPTSAGAFATNLSGSQDAFVTKLNANGSALSYSTFLGGSGYESARGIAVDAQRSAYVAGSTGSNDFPATGLPSPAINGMSDAFITKVNATGTSLTYSTFFGGAGSENGPVVAIDGTGNAYVAGATTSLDFPTTPGAHKTTLNNTFSDTFVVKFVQTEDSDTSPPALTSFDFSPTTLDTRVRADTLNVRMNIRDNLSGVAGAFIELRNPSRTTSQLASASRLSGTALNGSWIASVTVPQFAEAGTWTVERVQLDDRAGNHIVMSRSDLAAAGFPTDVTVISNADSTAPQVSSITITPSDVDVSSGPATITVTVAASDDSSGVNLGSNCFLYLAVVLVGPSGGQPREIGCWGFSQISGSSTNGVWRGTFTMPRYSEAGTWSISALMIEDALRNRTVLTDADARARGMVPLQVRSVPSDTQPPQLVDVAIAPAMINTAAGPAMVSVDVTVSDDLSGTELTFPGLSSLSAAVGFVSPSGAQRVFKSPLRLISGTPLNGVWRAADMTFPQFAESGTWRIARIDLKDAVGNRRSYLTADLGSVPSSVIVIRASLEADGTLSPAGGTVTDSAFGSRAQITAPAGVLSAATNVAIDVLESAFTLPLPTGYTTFGTYFVNVQMTPTPAWPLAAPGLTVVLPLREPLVPGQQIDLFRLEPSTARLEPALDASGQPIRGSVNEDGRSATFAGVARFSTIVGVLPNRVAVTIAVDPFRQSPDVATIKLHGQAPIQVALVSTATFDATSDVDQATLRFGRTGLEPSLRNCIRGNTDVNHDRLPDLVCFFTAGVSGFRSGDTRAIVRARTQAGVLVEGIVPVRVVN